MNIANFPEFFTTHHTQFASALCQQVDPETFFPDKGRSANEAAKKICAMCAHSQGENECLQGALERDEKYGVFGGFSEHERRDMKPARSQVAA